MTDKKTAKSTAAFAARHPTPDTSPLGIVAGSGRLPRQLAEACRKANRPCFALVFKDDPDAAAFADLPHAVVDLTAIGEGLEQLRAARVREIVLAGKVHRPSLSKLKPDSASARLLAHMGAALFGGDNALFKSIVEFLEQEGFTVIGADDVLSDLAAPEGVMGKIAPSERDRKDIAHGVSAAKMLGALDIGQAALVANGYVLGVEAAEGTDAMIERCAKLKHEPGAGVLVKMKKPSQESRVDLPAIGPQTVERMHAAGFAGIAVEAGGSLILDRDECIARADALGLFLIGVPHG